MDAMAVKSEVINVGNNRRRRLLRVPASPSEGGGDRAKCVKRRRREPPLPAIASNNGGEASITSPTGVGIKRSSRFRGVSRHRWTGRFEAHLWDKGSWNATQKKKGKQVYLGAYDEEESAARAYDLAALKYWGPTTFTNFPVSDYENEIQIMQNLTKEEYLASLRRRSSGFSRGVSKYRGVARHHHNGRWEARIGRVFGNKYLYLGTYSTQEEAAHAYDIAAIEYRGIHAVTNFDLSTYIRWLRPAAGATNTSNSPRQELRINVGMQSSAVLFQNGGSEHFSHRSRDPFAAAAVDADSPCKQEFLIPNQIPAGSSSNKSSPTALGLLLRSSIFRELVEKNSNEVAGDEETDGEDAKDHRRRHLVGGGGEEFRRIFCDGIADDEVPCIAPSIGDDEPNNIILPEESASFYDRTDQQSLWNGVLSTVSSIQ